MKINKNNRTILFVAGTLSKGGCERVISKLANHYAAKGYKVFIACLLSSRIEYKLDERIEVIDLVEKKRNVFSLFKWVRKLKTQIKLIKPSNIISFAGRVNIVALLASPKNTVIVSERNDPRYDNRGKLSFLLCKYLYRKKAKRIVFQTNEVKNIFSHKIYYKSVIIRNPIAKPKHVLNDYSNNKIVMVGRLAEQKNYEGIIIAMEKVLESIDVSIDIYGDGIEKEKLQKMVKDYSLENHIFFKGIVDDIEEKMLHYSMFILSSKYEGLSNSLMEAMSLGLACISTPVAGSNELINNYVNGIVIDDFSSNKMVLAIMELASSEELRRKLGRNAIKSLESCYEENIFKMWDKELNN